MNTRMNLRMNLRTNLRTNTRMNTRSPAILITFATLALGASACNPAVKTTTVTVDVIAPIILVEMTCPVSAEIVTDQDEAAYFDSYPVYCKGRDNARQFASLSSKQRARLASEQVLAQKGIANKTCPITGEPLNANASAVVYQGTAIGFASSADANQFRSLNADGKAKVIKQWKAAGDA